ncbi:hypothetical protein [Tenacibaculum sp. SG-28]|uniref:hypothetical protein n=1 Tax=Tenacibaculum sp. SG-28 TaxID=754426 RepID=UPI001E50384E|nr:hypothetical protein [Tenacibaculum sp. SG-28]
MKNQLRAIIEDNTTRKGRIFDYFIQGLIFISLISFSIETLPEERYPFLQTTIQHH